MKTLLLILLVTLLVGCDDRPPTCKDEATGEQVPCGETAQETRHCVDADGTVVPDEQCQNAPEERQAVPGAESFASEWDEEDPVTHVIIHRHYHHFWYYGGGRSWPVGTVVHGGHWAPRPGIIYTTPSYRAGMSVIGRPVGRGVDLSRSRFAPSRTPSMQPVSRPTSPPTQRNSASPGRSWGSSGGSRPSSATPSKRR